MQFLSSRVLIVTLLCLLTLAAFSQVVHHEFVLYDDDDYITENPQVQAGLSLQNVLWAFTTGHASNWHPVTWLSHMLDCHLYGLKPRGHHVTNLVLHVANTILLFLVLASMTQASAGAGGAAGGQNEKTGPGVDDSLWASGLVAALFAIHPLHVQPVAWIAERKELLAALFWLLTMGAYLRYLQKPPSFTRYLVIVVFFSMGLMSKPSLVTLPFALLLLDYWPLGRFDANPRNLWKKSRLVLEKLPLMALSAIGCVVPLSRKSKAVPSRRFPRYPSMPGSEMR